MMKKYILFIGCQIPARVPQYESAVRAVLDRFGVRLVDERQFNCCGYPLRDSDEGSFLLSSVRNLALAEKAGLELLVLCKCCFGSLKKAENMMQDGGRLQDEIRALLNKENLEYHGKTNIKHLLSVLYHDIGTAALQEKIEKPYKDLNIAVQYGCHALRPSLITRFDDPLSPTIFDELVELTGAKSIDYTGKLECCGSHAMGINNDLSISMMKKKLDNTMEAGARFICTACPYCQIQFDTVQRQIIAGNGDSKGIASILYPQLLGICMGLDDEALGLERNRIDISRIRSYLNEE
jgi:heterodisulfide reductase subunit B